MRRDAIIQTPDRPPFMTDAITPQGKLDLSALPDFHSSLAARMNEDIQLDLANVVSIGALCLQCCLAAARATIDAGKSFDIVNTPDAVRAQIESMGFTVETLSKGAT
ncbi:MAG: STAS domain-containing protein [Pseudomonadota bacterium]